MITEEKAIQLARAFCLSQGEVAKNVYFDVNTPVDYADCFYFDFKIVDGQGNPSEEMLGGAPGFTINKKTCETKIIGWKEYQDLRTKVN
jgi:hypothetical protein